MPKLQLDPQAASLRTEQADSRPSDLVDVATTKLSLDPWTEGDPRIRIPAIYVDWLYGWSNSPELCVFLYTTGEDNSWPELRWRLFEPDVWIGRSHPNRPFFLANHWQWTPGTKGKGCSGAVVQVKLEDGSPEALVGPGKGCSLRHHFRVGSPAMVPVVAFLLEESKDTWLSVFRMELSLPLAEYLVRTKLRNVHLVQDGQRVICPSLYPDRVVKPARVGDLPFLPSLRSAWNQIETWHDEEPT